MIDTGLLSELIMLEFQKKRFLNFALFRNIVLTGGNSLFSGYKDRLETEIRALAPDLMKVKLKSIEVIFFTTFCKF